MSSGFRKVVRRVEPLNGDTVLVVREGKLVRKYKVTRANQQSEGKVCLYLEVQTPDCPRCRRPLDAPEGKSDEYSMWACDPCDLGFLVGSINLDGSIIYE